MSSRRAPWVLFVLTRGLLRHERARAGPHSKAWSEPEVFTTAAFPLLSRAFSPLTRGAYSTSKKKAMAKPASRMAPFGEVPEGEDLPRGLVRLGPASTSLLGPPT